MRADSLLSCILWAMAMQGNTSVSSNMIFSSLMTWSILRLEEEPDSTLGEILSKVPSLPSSHRARLLEINLPLEDAYASVAHQGQTAAPALDAEFYHRYLGRTKSNGRPWKLDDDRGGLVARGGMDESGYLLSERHVDIMKGSSSHEHMRTWRLV